LTVADEMIISAESKVWNRRGCHSIESVNVAAGGGSTQGASLLGQRLGVRTRGGPASRSYGPFT